MYDTGEMADSLSMEHLTKAAQEFIPWFAEQEHGYMYMLTKSDNVDSLLKLKHNKHTILSWSLNVPLVSQQFELGAPDLAARIKAAKKAQEAGYPVRVRLDPIVPIIQWQHHYAGTIKRIFEEIQPERITLGTLRFEENLWNMRDSIIRNDQLKKLMGFMEPMLEKVKLDGGKKSVGKYSFPGNMRHDLFGYAINEIRKYSDCDIALCKETSDMWQAVGLNLKECKCVCKYDSVDMTIPKREVITMTKETKPEKKSEKKTTKAAEETPTVSLLPDVTYEPRQHCHLDIMCLVPDPNQPRKSIDDAELNELKTSIEKHGILQPILFRKDETGKHIIVSGERRYQASLLAKLKTIPAIYIEGHAAEIALVENLLRVDLTAIEEAEALQRLKTEASYSNRQLANVIGKAESTISEILKLNQLPEKLRNKYRANKVLSKRTLLEVAKAATPEDMEKLFKKVVKKEKKRDELRSERNTSEGKTRGADVVCRTMSNGLLKALSGLDLTVVAVDKRADVEKALNDALAALASKLGYKVVKG